MTTKLSSNGQGRQKLGRLSARTENAIFDTVNTLVMVFVCVVTLYPFLNTVAVSLNDSVDAVRGGIYLWPRVLSLKSYETILIKTSAIPHAAMISALRAAVGTGISVPLSMMLAFVMTRRDYVLRGFITKLVLLTMYVSGGLIPTFLTYRAYGLTNNFLVYVLPTAISPFNVLVMRSFIDGIPFELTESAKIDGASEYRILFTIIFPLSMPVIATISLFVAVNQWNQWFDTMLYCSSNKGLSTLQYELKKVLDTANSMVSSDASEALMDQNSSGGRVTTQTIRAAMTVVSVVPIACIYPFLQRFFVKGMTLGAVKG
ncbi:MAG: carbohydrate ABC transporter permease [Christensenellaceae bacterium]|jgi:putative aldouronate transport system permease protein|nr:carbohydrate ABC transporter permease [Christensenellaceae bacterium]